MTNIDSLAKSTYENLFNWLVAKLNENLVPNKEQI